MFPAFNLGDIMDPAGAAPPSQDDDKKKKKSSKRSAIMKFVGIDTGTIAAKNPFASKATPSKQSLFYLMSSETSDLPPWDETNPEMVQILYHISVEKACPRGK